MENSNDMIETNSINDSKPFITTKTSIIKCCICGLEFNPSQTNSGKCLSCFTEEFSIHFQSEQGFIQFCRYCKRYNRPPWINCGRESKELLNICLKKIKELSSLKIVDASHIWTEPHSRRIHIKIIVQKEVTAGKVIEQTLRAEFIEEDTICDDCKKEFTPHTWSASIQLRQNANHKRTFFYLEQMILKANMAEKCVKIKEEKNGIDFFFKNKADATKFLEFIQGIIATHVKPSKQLISQDDNKNEYNYKYNFSVEIPKICKDDLVIVSSRLKKMLGGCSRLLICSRVTNSIHLMDPFTGRTTDISSSLYFSNDSEITTISSKGNLVEFVVMNVQELKNGLYELDLSRVSDWKNFNVKSTLKLSEGQSILGYDLTTLSFFLEDDTGLNCQYEIVLVKKLVEKKKKHKKTIKRLEMEMANENNIHKKNFNEKENEKEFEEFAERWEEEEEGDEKESSKLEEGKGRKEEAEKTIEEKEKGKETKGEGEEAKKVKKDSAEEEGGEKEGGTENEIERKKEAIVKNKEGGKEKLKLGGKRKGEKGKEKKSID